MSVRELLAVGGALAIGVAHGVFLSFVHTHLAAYFSVAAWIHSLDWGAVASNALLFPIDLALNLILSIPAAVVLRLLKPWNYAWYVLLALLAFLTLVYIPLALPLGQSSLSWYTSWAVFMQVAPIPLAAWLVARSRVPPNKSFKGMSLRGTP